MDIQKKMSLDQESERLLDKKAGERVSKNTSTQENKKYQY
jgi:hypothetical protein